ncbi:MULTISPECIES: DNA2/NAM7 family helicase [Bacillus]|uniref:DNA2/NAM7 family helicase n=1 Tax=Bacillus TaxID=1386 RepID=UPI000382AEBD|nr:MULTISPECIES: DNA2/NAM7 family helicase [Bacillus]
MSKLLLEKIELVKDILGDDPFSLVIGEIVEEEKQIAEKLVDNILKDYYFITRKYKKLNSGVITIYGHQKLESIQFYVEDMLDGADKWICIGTVENYPLFINKIDGEVSCLFGNLIDQNFVIESYGDFSSFLENYFLGSKYIDIGLSFVEAGGIRNPIGSKDDEWYKLLELNRLV